MVLLFVNYRYAYSLPDPRYSERCQVPFSADNFKFYAVIFHFYKVRGLIVVLFATILV